MTIMPGRFAQLLINVGAAPKAAVAAAKEPTAAAVYLDVLVPLT